MPCYEYVLGLSASPLPFVAELAWSGGKRGGGSLTCGLRGEGKRGREGETIFGGLAKQSDNLVYQLICKYVR